MPADDGRFLVRPFRPGDETEIQEPEADEEAILFADDEDLELEIEEEEEPEQFEIE